MYKKVIGGITVIINSKTNITTNITEIYIILFISSVLHL